MQCLFSHRCLLPRCRIASCGVYSITKLKGTRYNSAPAGEESSLNFIVHNELMTDNLICHFEPEARR